LVKSGGRLRRVAGGKAEGSRKKKLGKMPQPGRYAISHAKGIGGQSGENRC